MLSAESVVVQVEYASLACHGARLTWIYDRSFLPQRFAESLARVKDTSPACAPSRISQSNDPNRLNTILASGLGPQNARAVRVFKRQAPNHALIQAHLSEISSDL
jgi:hypothetical protein